MTRAGFLSGLATAAVVAGVAVMPADASINSQVTACPPMFSLCLHACSAPDLSRDACRVRRCHRGDVQMSMDSNSFSVLSDNQKVYKSTGVSSYPVAFLPRLPWSSWIQWHSSSTQQQQRATRLSVQIPQQASPASASRRAGWCAGTRTCVRGSTDAQRFTCARMRAMSGDGERARALHPPAAS